MASAGCSLALLQLVCIIFFTFVGWKVRNFLPSSSTNLYIILNRRYLYLFSMFNKQIKTFIFKKGLFMHILSTRTIPMKIIRVQ